MSRPLSDSDRKKAARERAVFRGFAELAGLQVPPRSIRSRRPPAPDLVCRIDGQGLVAFELVELVDEDLAESVGRGAGEGVYVGDPTMAAISSKLSKPLYKTRHPVEFLAWANRLTTPPSIWKPSYVPRLRVLPLGQFRRMWFVNFGVRPGESGVWFVNPPVSRRGRSQPPGPAAPPRSSRRARR